MGSGEAHAADILTPGTSQGDRFWLVGRAACFLGPVGSHFPFPYAFWQVAQLVGGAFRRFESQEPFGLGPLACSPPAARLLFGPPRRATASSIPWLRCARVSESHERSTSRGFHRSATLFRKKKTARSRTRTGGAGEPPLRHIEDNFSAAGLRPDEASFGSATPSICRWARNKQKREAPPSPLSRHFHAWRAAAGTCAFALRSPQGTEVSS